MQQSRIPVRRLAAVLSAALTAASAAHASDHLDSPAVVADPRADIGDVYAWTSPDATRLELVMTIVGHEPSDRIRYTFHVDSGASYGRTTESFEIACRFDKSKRIDCRAGDDRAIGDAGDPRGLASRGGTFRVFAGLRDDPFFNNVKGSRDAFKTASDAILDGAPLDAAGCPAFDRATADTILDRWKHTDGGPGKDFLAGWTPASLVVSIDLGAVARGGRMLAVWGDTSSAKRRIDRAGRPLTGNALLAPLAPDDVSDALKDRYNQATPPTSADFVPAIEESLGLYDAYDGRCGNAWLAGDRTEPGRYRRLATLLADDRLWVNATSGVCTQLFAVELAALSDRKDLAGDCGGRAPGYDAVDTYRSLLANGTTSGIDDGVDRDDKTHSTRELPFLAPPDSAR